VPIPFLDNMSYNINVFKISNYKEKAL